MAPICTVPHLQYFNRAARFFGLHGSARPRRYLGRFVAGLSNTHTQTNTHTHTHTRYDTIRDAILTCARKPTRVSLIYRTEPTTKKCKNRKKTKSRKQIYSEITVNSPGNPRSKYLSRRKEGLQWERFVEKDGFKPGHKERVGDGMPNTCNSKYDCWQIKTV